MQVCLGTSVFPRRKSKCHGILGEGGPRQVGISETEHGPEEASHSSMAAVLPSECSLPDLRGRGAWCQCRGITQRCGPHTHVKQSHRCQAALPSHVPPPGKQTARPPQVWEAACPRGLLSGTIRNRTLGVRDEVSPAVFPLLLRYSCADRGRKGKTHEPHKKGR